ncbi:VirB3 family type IV secretion system protein [Paralcaligenes ginsengisoli]|jgi:type IV secretion system protein VirB3
MAANSYPVFKGLGRKATFMGIPTTLLLGAFACVAIIAMMAGLAWWGLLFLVIPALALLTRDDDKALDVLWLEFKTRRRNRNQRFWRGSSYALQGYHRHRPWRHLIK